MIKNIPSNFFHAQDSLPVLKIKNQRCFWQNKKFEKLIRVTVFFYSFYSYLKKIPENYSIMFRWPIKTLMSL